MTRVRAIGQIILAIFLSVLYILLVELIKCPYNFIFKMFDKRNYKNKGRWTKERINRLIYISSNFILN